MYACQAWGHQRQRSRCLALPYLGNMMRRSDLVLVATGPLLATILWALHALAGRAIIEAVYGGQTPFDLLNGVINGQAMHPVDYHLHKARELVRGLVWLASAAGPMVAVYLASVRRWPHSVVAQPLLGGALLSTVLLCSLYLLRLPLLKLFPGWFWPLHDKPLPLAWLALPLVAGGWLLLRVVRSAPGRRRRNLMLLIFWCVCLQQGFVWFEGHGFTHMKQRLTDTGHAIFAHTAVDQPSIWQVMTRYDELLVSETAAGYFHATKPPGLQVFVMSVERLAHVLPGAGVDRLAAFAALLFPLLACACLLPLHGLMRLVAPDAEEAIPALLYVMVPSFVLINLHADQYLYPLLGTCCLYLYTRALLRQELGTAVLAGLMFCLSLWISFALLALAPVVPVLAWVAARRSGWRSVGRSVAVAGGGCLLGFLLFLWGTDYDALQRWRLAMAAHEAAKIAQWGLAERVYFAVLNLVEFGLWCGPAMVLLVVADIGQTLKRLRTGDIDLEQGLVLSLAVILMGLSIAGGSAGETARLWLFLLPLVAVAGARTLRRMAPGSVVWIVALQFVLSLVMKARQDFL